MTVRLPLAATAALVALAVVAATVAGVAVGGLVAGAGCGLVASCAVGAVAARLAAAVRRLADAAATQTPAAAPLAPAPAPPAAARLPVAELADLADVLAGLHRLRGLAEERADRSARLADQAAAGTAVLLASLVDAEEGARGQLAAELHDTVAQSLMIARSLLAAGPRSPRQLAQLSDYVEDAEEQLRSVMARTRPPALRDGDLAQAVSGLCADVRARYGLEVAMAWPRTEHPLPLPAAVTVYRFFQEALLNVVKHADVDDAALALEVHDDALVATVRDEGPGFDPAMVVPERGRHVGLSLLRERARLSGGALTVDSGATGGTTLRLRLPRGRATAGRAPAPVLPQQRREATPAR